jgi:hypothetical protein
MAEIPQDPNADEGTPVRPGPESPPRTPRWVIGLGIVALFLILAVAVQFVLGVQHGPGTHGAL